MADVRIIAAVGKGGAIGVNNSIPWSDKDDMAWFRKCTTEDKYAIVVMGRKTYESILVSVHPKAPLPGRNLLIHSTEKTTLITHRGETLHYNPVPPDGILETFPNRTLWIAGGQQIYKMYLPFANRFYLSKIDYDGPFDAQFPFSELMQIYGVTK